MLACHHARLNQLLNVRLLPPACTVPCAHRSVFLVSFFLATPLSVHQCLAVLLSICRSVFLSAWPLPAVLGLLCLVLISYWIEGLCCWDLSALNTHICPVNAGTYMQASCSSLLASAVQMSQKRTWLLCWSSCLVGESQPECSAVGTA